MNNRGTDSNCWRRFDKLFQSKTSSRESNIVLPQKPKVRKKKKKREAAMLFFSPAQKTPNQDHMRDESIMLFSGVLKLLLKIKIIAQFNSEAARPITEYLSLQSQRPGHSALTLTCTLPLPELCTHAPGKQTAGLSWKPPVMHNSKFSLHLHFTSFWTVF